MRLIDADALIDKYGDWYTEEGTEEGYIGTIKGIVDSMPTIEPERPKGEWKIKKATIHPYGNDVCCSVCCHTMGSSFGYKFCPMCGAKMEV